MAITQTSVHRGSLKKKKKKTFNIQTSVRTKKDN